MPPPPYRFTSYDLDTSIEVARALDELGGKASSDALAHKLGYKSKNNGAFLTRIANARLFGLVDGVASALSPSGRAINIIRPDYPETERRARLDAFEDVPLFKAVLDQYHGAPLPDSTGMKNALEARWQIDGDRSSMVLARFLDSADQAGLFEAAGDRTKLIRPTFGADSNQGVTNGGSSGGVGSHLNPPPSTNTGARLNKVVDGVLDELPPPSDGWSESGLTQWLAFFESALRVVYRLPKPSDGGP